MSKNKLFSGKIVSYYSTEQNVSDIANDDPLYQHKNPVISSFILKSRSLFSSVYEKSHVAHFFEYLYRSLLSCPLSAVAVFLLVFSVVSFSLRFFISDSKTDFFLESRNWIPVIMFFVSLLFMPVKKDLATLLSQSKSFSLFEFSYDKKILYATSKGMSFSSGYSTAFFIGVLAGITSVLFAPFSVFLFITLIVCAVIILNKPESGVLLTVFLHPFLSDSFTLLLVYFTFISLLFKYLSSKRHISFDRDELSLLICTLIFLTSGLATASGKTGIIEALQLISAILVYICIKNLIKSFSLFNNCIRLITGSALIASVLTLAVHFINRFLNYSFIGRILEADFANYIYTYFTNNLILTVIMAAMTPINLSLFIGHEKKQIRIKHGISFITQLICVLLNGNIPLLTAVVFSCLIVICFKKTKAIVLLPLSPFISTAIVKLVRVLPFTDSIIKTPSLDNTMNQLVSGAIKSNTLFGIGLGKENFVSCITSYALPSIDSYAHPQTTLQGFIVYFGIPAAIFIAIVIMRIISNNLRIAISTRNINKTADAANAGFIGAALCIVIASTCLYITSTSTIPVFFAIICALVKSSEKCMTSDYIDNSKIRL